MNGKDCYASGIVDLGVEASLLPHSLYRKWIGAPLSKSKARLLSFSNTEIAGLRGQFTVTIEYNDCRAKVTNATCSIYDQSRNLGPKIYANHGSPSPCYDIGAIGQWMQSPQIRSMACPTSQVRL
uniref:Uncharacterized protein n=1 Tax=Romanomermis culicivorax TaxID=13658 RepID=A0A915HME2_ROMCU